MQPWPVVHSFSYMGLPSSICLSLYTLSLKRYVAPCHSHLQGYFVIVTFATVENGNVDTCVSNGLRLCL